jgi:aminoglycoside phosphotransferase (APT) family kinase protein
MAAEPINEGRPPGADYDVVIKEQRRDPEVLRTVLQGWLGSKLGKPTLRLAPITTPETNGVANETLIVDATWPSASGGDVHQRFVIRIATDDPLYLDADIHRHYKVYESLQNFPNVPSPQVIGFEPDRSLLGMEFFTMEFIAGDIPGDRPHYTTAGFVFDATPAQRRTMWENAIRAMAELHKVPASAMSFLSSGTGRSGLEEDLAYWRRYLDWAAPTEPNPHLEQGWTWLQKNMPANPPTGFSWGDSRYSNIIFRDFTPVSVLDWDTVSLTGNEADVAWWITMDHHATGLLPGIGTPDELVAVWENAIGRKAEHLRYHMVCTSFRLGAILVKLFDQMCANGLMPPEVAREQASNSMFIQTLCQLLDLTPPGDITAPLPDVKL